MQSRNLVKGFSGGKNSFAGLFAPFCFYWTCCVGELLDFQKEKKEKKKIA